MLEEFSDRRHPAVPPVFLYILRRMLLPTGLVKRTRTGSLMICRLKLIVLVLWIIAGDFNARVGCGARGDSWDSVHGHYGVGHLNENSEAMLS